MVSFLAALSALLASPAAAQDMDGDGHIAAWAGGTDCVDTLDDLIAYGVDINVPNLDPVYDPALIHPRALEVCEGTSAGAMVQIDNDCDGSVNSRDGVYPYNGEDTTIETWEGNPWGSTYYRDADLDDYGDADMTYALCELEEGFLSSFGDCDDSDETINPGTFENCDGRDENCDGQIDEPGNMAASNSGCVVLYADADLDGFGDPSEALCMCYGTGEPGSDCPFGYEFDGIETCYLAEDSDCYDDDAEIRPRFTEAHPLHQLRPSVAEYQPESAADWGEALDGDDNDCDGLVPLAEIDCDGDRSLAALPSGLDYNEPFATSADLGLDACEPGGAIEIACGDASLSPECDETTGLWLVETAATGFYDGGERYYEAFESSTNASFSYVGDCDDLCAERSPNLGEACDGIDNDCVGDSDDVYAYVDTDGVPDPMSPEAERAGYVSAGEVDLDGDGYLACSAYVLPDQDHLADAACDTSYQDEALFDDCAPEDPSIWPGEGCEDYDPDYGEEPWDRYDSGPLPPGCGESFGCAQAGAGAAGLWLLALIGLARRRDG